MIVRDLSYFLATMAVAFTAGKVSYNAPLSEGAAARTSQGSLLIKARPAPTDYQAAMEAKPHEYGLVIIGAWAEIQRLDSGT